MFQWDRERFFIWVVQLVSKFFMISLNTPPLLDHESLEPSLLSPFSISSSSSCSKLSSASGDGRRLFKNDYNRTCEKKLVWICHEYCPALESFEVISAASAPCRSLQSATSKSPDLPSPLVVHSLRRLLAAFFFFFFKLMDLRLVLGGDRETLNQCSKGGLLVSRMSYHIFSQMLHDHLPF